MAYDEGLATRIQEHVAEVAGVTEKRMFGGIAFLADGHMFAGIVGETLMLRLGEPAAANALRKKHVRPMDFTGKPMKGYVYVDAEGLESDADLAGWLDAARAFVASLPPKTKTGNKKVR